MTPMQILTKPFSEGLAVALVTLLATEIAVGFVGNLRICLLLYKRKELRKVPHLLLGQLSITGLLVSITTIPVLLSVVVSGQYLGRSAPPFACVFRYSSSLFFLALDSLTLFAMAGDRHDCVCRPFARRITPANVKKIVLAIWCIALGLTLGHIPLAYMDLKDGCLVYALKKNISIYYIIINANVLVFTTAVAIAITMVRVVKKLRSSQFLSQSNRDAEVQITKLSLGVMAVYLICIFPLILFTIVVSAAGITNKHVEGAKLFLLALSNFNFVINPFLHSRICKSRTVQPQNSDE